MQVDSITKSATALGLTPMVFPLLFCSYASRTLRSHGNLSGSPQRCQLRSQLMSRIGQPNHALIWISLRFG